MIRATHVLARESWTAAAADRVVLDFEDRYRRRIAMVGVGGLEFLLDLPGAVMLRAGDALQLDDGRLIEVLAAPEPMVEIRGRDVGDLVRLAWHIGNRHIPAQLLPKAIRIRRDHVIEEMVRSLGAKVTEIEAPFDPEGGAYAVAAAADHGHAHREAAHGHHHERDRPGHDHRHAAGHAHGSHDH